jgi:hypothetical protein
LYISLDGELTNINDYLIKKSPILDILSENLLITDVIIIRNDTSNKLQNKVKLNNGQVDIKALEEAVNTTAEYKKSLAKLKEYFNSVFYKSQMDKILITNERKLSDLEEPVDGKIIVI